MARKVRSNSNVERVAAIPDAPDDRFINRLGVQAILAGLLSAVLLLGTSPSLTMTLDEGVSIVRAYDIIYWIQIVSGVVEDESSPWSQESIFKHWQYTSRVEGHPAFFGTVIALGYLASCWFLAPLEACRFGPLMVFSLACGAMYFRMGREYSRTAAVTSVVGMLLMPRLFAHMHFAHVDCPLVAFWVLSWATFAPARNKLGWAVLWGILLGMTLSSKATGWVAPVPFLVWAGLYRDKPAAKAIVIGFPVAVLTFYLLNPTLWFEPLSGLWRFFYLNTHRELNVPTCFFGDTYDLRHPLPWYNTIVWTAITVPIGILALAGVGIFSILRRVRKEAAGVLLIGHWTVLLVVRATPYAPPHDAVRLFLPAFPFLAALAGVGAWRIIRWFSCQEHENRLGRSRMGFAAIVAVTLIYLGSATSLWLYRPQWLSYYNLAIGGLPGATAAGMEPTYYWDSLDSEVCAWLGAHTGPDEKVHFGSPANECLSIMLTFGMLPVEFRHTEPGTFRWYVFQRRPSALLPEDRWLLEHGVPAYQKRIRPGGVGPWRLDEPLLDVYPYDQYLAARSATAAPAE